MLTLVPGTDWVLKNSELIILICYFHLHDRKEKKDIDINLSKNFISAWQTLSLQEGAEIFYAMYGGPIPYFAWKEFGDL